MHGNQRNSSGTGFTVFSDSSNTVTAVVQTNETQYTVSYTLPSSSTIRSFIMTWDKNVGLKLYMNTDLVGEDQGTGVAEAAIAVSDQEYILLFGQYHFAFSYLSATFEKFSTWKKPLSATEIQQLSTLVGKSHDL